MIISKIKATPALDLEDSKSFLKNVEEGLKNPVGPVPTPGIDSVVSLIMEDARKSEKENKYMNCMDCVSHVVMPDPDPNDWFCDDDMKVKCAENGKMVTVACRPHHLRKECETPDWCPRKDSNNEGS